MTVVNQAVEAMKQMPPATQDKRGVGHSHAGEGQRAHRYLPPEHIAAVMEGLAQLERGEGVVGEPEDLAAAAFAHPRRP